MYKGIYAEKKTFSKFDNEHYLCYLNEQREEYSPEPDARSGEVTEPVSAPIGICLYRKYGGRRYSD